MNNNSIPAGLPDWLAPHTGEVARWSPTPSGGRTCWVASCDHDAHLHGLCKTHHMRAVRKWKPRPSQTTKRTNTGAGPTPDSEAGSES